MAKKWCAFCREEAEDKVEQGLGYVELCSLCADRMRAGGETVAMLGLVADAIDRLVEGVNELRDTLHNRRDRAGEVNAMDFNRVGGER